MDSLILTLSQDIESMQAKIHKKNKMMRQKDERHAAKEQCQEQVQAEADRPNKRTQEEKVAREVRKAWEKQQSICSLAESVLSQGVDIGVQEVRFAKMKDKRQARALQRQHLPQDDACESP